MEHKFPWFETTNQVTSWVSQVLALFVTPGGGIQHGKLGNPLQAGRLQWEANPISLYPAW